LALEDNVQEPGTPFARGHLRLASAPISHGVGRRMAAHMRAGLAMLLALLSTLAAWFMAALALLPLLTRRAPAGRRLRQRPAREARVIPFQPRRRAVPR
jgi:hypothetical protein